MAVTPPPFPTSYQGLAFPKSPPAAPTGGAGPPILVGALSYLPRLTTAPKPASMSEEEEQEAGASKRSEIETLLARYGGPQPRAVTPPEGKSLEDEKRQALVTRHERVEEDPDGAPSPETIRRRGLLDLFGWRATSPEPGRPGRRGAFGETSRADSGIAPAGSGSAQAAASLGLLHSKGGFQGRAGLGFSGRRGGALSSPDATVRSGLGGSGTPESSGCLVPIDRRTGGIGTRAATPRPAPAASLLPPRPTSPPDSAGAARTAPLTLADGGKGGRSSESSLEAAGAGAEAGGALARASSDAQPRVGGSAEGLAGDVAAGAALAAAAEEVLSLRDSRQRLTWRDAPLIRMRPPGCNSFRSMEAFQQAPAPADRRSGPPKERPEDEKPGPGVAPARSSLNAASAPGAPDPRVDAWRGGIGPASAESVSASETDAPRGACDTPSFYPALSEARPREVPGTTQPSAKPGLATFVPPDRSALEAQNPLAAREPAGQTPVPAHEGAVRLGAGLSDLEIGPPTGYDEKGKIQIHKGKSAIGPRGIGGGGDGAELFAVGVALSELAHWQVTGSRIAIRMQSYAKAAAQATALANAAHARAEGATPEVKAAEASKAAAQESVAELASAMRERDATDLAHVNAQMAAARTAVEHLSRNFRYDPETLQDLARNAVRAAQRGEDREIRRQASRERRPGYVAGRRAEAGREQERADRAQARAKHYFDRAHDSRLPARERNKALARANHFAGQAVDAYARTGRALEILAAHEVRKHAGKPDPAAEKQAAIRKRADEATRGLRRQFDETMKRVEEVEEKRQKALDRAVAASYDMADDVLATVQQLERRKAALLGEAQKLREAIDAARAKAVEDAEKGPDAKGSKGATASGGAMPKAAAQLVANYRKQRGMNAAMAATLALELAKEAYAKATDTGAREQERYAAVRDLEAYAGAAAASAEEAEAAAEEQPGDEELQDAAKEAAAKAEEARRLLARACEGLHCCKPPCKEGETCVCKPKDAPEESDPEKGGDGTSIAKHASARRGLSEEELPLEPPGAARGDSDVIPADAEASRTAQKDKTAKTPDGSKETRTVAEPRTKPPPPVDATSVAGPPRPPPPPPPPVGSSPGIGPLRSRSSPSYVVTNQYMATAVLLDALVAVPPAEATAEGDASAEASEEAAQPPDENDRRRIARILAKLLERRDKALSRLAQLAGMAATREQAIEIAKEAIAQIKQSLAVVGPIINQLIDELFGEQIRAERTERGITIDLWGHEVRSEALSPWLRRLAVAEDDLRLLPGLDRIPRKPAVRQRTRLSVEDDPLYRRLEMVTWNLHADIGELTREIERLSELTDYEAEGPRRAIGERIRAEQQALLGLDFAQIRRELLRSDPVPTPGGPDAVLRRIEQQIRWAELTADHAELAVLGVQQEEADRNGRLGSWRNTFARWKEGKGYLDWADVVARNFAGTKELPHPRADFTLGSTDEIEVRLRAYAENVADFSKQVKATGMEIEKLASRTRLAETVFITSALAAGAAAFAAVGAAKVAGLAIGGFVGGATVGAARQGIMLVQHGLGEFDWARTLGDVVYAGNIGAAALPAAAMVPILGTGSGLYFSSRGVMEGIQEIRNREAVGFLDVALGIFGLATTGGVLAGQVRRGLASRPRPGQMPARYLDQGYSPQAARLLAGPYSGRGHHFIQDAFLAKLITRVGRDSIVGKLLGAFKDSQWNLNRRTWMSRGEFNEWHARLHGQGGRAAFGRKSFGGSPLLRGEPWKASRVFGGVKPHGKIAYILESSPTPLKLMLGGVPGIVVGVTPEGSRAE